MAVLVEHRVTNPLPGVLEREMCSFCFETGSMCCELLIVCKDDSPHEVIILSTSTRCGGYRSLNSCQVVFLNRPSGIYILTLESVSQLIKAEPSFTYQSTTEIVIQKKVHRIMFRSLSVTSREWVNCLLHRNKFSLKIMIWLSDRTATFPYPVFFAFVYAVIKRSLEAADYIKYSSPIKAKKNSFICHSRTSPNAHSVSFIPFFSQSLISRSLSFR